jgi:putative ABC transport system permease protein
VQHSASFLEAVRVAAGSLRASKMRTALTLLGIILATTTLIAVMSVIHGMNSFVARIITDEVGANAYHVERMMMIGKRDWKKWAEAQRRNPELSPAEFEFLRTHVTLTRAIGMQAGRSVPVQRGSSRMEGVQLRGSSPNLGVINNMQAASGRFLSDIDDQRRLMAAFIGNDIRQRLFAGVDPVGKTLEIEGRRFEIVGVSKVASSESRWTISSSSPSRRSSRSTACGVAWLITRWRSTASTLPKPRMKHACCCAPGVTSSPGRMTLSAWPVRTPSPKPGRI